MATAVVKVNGVAGSNFDLPINTVVNLSNSDNTGATTWSWSILSQPPGTTDGLTGGSTSTPTFTPKKEGSYLIKLDVNGGGGGLSDTQVCAIKFLKTRLRAPAAGETGQQDAVHGWETERYTIDQRIDNLYASEFGIVVGVAGQAGLTR